MAAVLDGLKIALTILLFSCRCMNIFSTESNSKYFPVYRDLTEHYVSNTKTKNFENSHLF